MIKIKLTTLLIMNSRRPNCLRHVNDAFVKFKIIIFSRNKHYLSPTLISILLSAASLAVFALLFVAAYFIHKKMKTTLELSLHVLEEAMPVLQQMSSFKFSEVHDVIFKLIEIYYNLNIFNYLINFILKKSKIIY